MIAESVADEVDVRVERTRTDRATADGPKDSLQNGHGLSPRASTRSAPLWSTWSTPWRLLRDSMDHPKGEPSRIDIAPANVDSGLDGPDGPRDWPGAFDDSCAEPLGGSDTHTPGYRTDDLESRAGTSRTPPGNPPRDKPTSEEPTHPHPLPRGGQFDEGCEARHPASNGCRVTALGGTEGPKTSVSRPSSLVLTRLRARNLKNSLP